MTEIILSARGKAQMLKKIKDALGKDLAYRRQLKPFLAGKVKTEVCYRKVWWSLVETDIDWKKKFVPCPLLTDGTVEWPKGQYSNGYMHYGKKDSKHFEVHHSTGGLLYMRGRKMILNTYPNIGKVVNGFAGDKIRIDKVELNEDSIEIILGPAIW
jgi:hypothetical protein